MGCSLMILQNQSIKDLMFLQNSSGRTILHSICIFGHWEMLKFLESMMDRKEFIDHLFLHSFSGGSGTPIEYALKKADISIVKYLFSVKEVQARYENNDPLIFKLIVLLFGGRFNSNAREK